MFIQMTNKNPAPKKSFYKTIETIALSYQFEAANEFTSTKLLREIEYAIKTNWPKVSTIIKISVDMDLENYTPRLTLNQALIDAMELYYPEAMI